MTRSQLLQIARTLLPGLCLLLAWTASTGGTADKIYKWVDQDGSIQYSRTPPPNAEQVIEVRKAPPPANGAANERSRLEEQVDSMNKRSEERQNAAAKAEHEAKNAEIRSKNCATAHKNLAELQKGGIKRYRTADGEIKHMTEEDRQQRITEANNQIAKFCTD